MPTEFIATHTNSDENLLGWNSRYIYLFATDATLKLKETEVFNAIGSAYQKGSVRLRSRFFSKCNDGQSFKITMYFLTQFKGETLLFETGVMNNSTATEYIVPTKNNNFHTFPSGFETKLCKYEVILTKFRPVGGSDVNLFVTGCVTYSRADNTNASDGDVSFIHQQGTITFDENITPVLILNTKGTAEILPRNITIEEIK